MAYFADASFCKAIPGLRHAQRMWNRQDQSSTIKHLHNALNLRI